jgi:predicted RNA binding protein YcfA (HicA-like mRNA interferase family)
MSNPTAHKVVERTRRYAQECNKYITFMVKSSEVLRKLRRKGWYVARQKGSHVMLRHPEKSDMIVVPDHGSKEVSKGILHKISRLSGLKF